MCVGLASHCSILLEINYLTSTFYLLIFFSYLYYPNLIILKPIKNVPKFVLKLTVAVITSIQLSTQNESMAQGSPPEVPENGYVILSNGDTLHGKIMWTDKYVESNPAEIKFIEENGVKKIFNAGEINGFGNQRRISTDNNSDLITLEMEHYVSLPSYKKGLQVFMYRLMGGRITIYLNRYSIVSSKYSEDTRIDGIAFSYSPNDGLWIGPSYRTDYSIVQVRYSSYYVSKDNAAHIKVDKQNYNTFFKTLFGDCPVITDEINKNPDLIKFKNFMILAEVYNQVCL